MSAVANWSYTATATHWARLSRNGWSGRASFASPATFACDYRSEARSERDADGVEFTTRHTLWTERSAIKRGDFVLIGSSAAADPTVVDGAEEVRSVRRDADTFDRNADDFVVMT